MPNSFLPYKCIKAKFKIGLEIDGKTYTEVLKQYYVNNGSTPRRWLQGRLYNHDNYSDNKWWLVHLKSPESWLIAM